jgi:hypothetical protein
MYPNITLGHGHAMATLSRIFLKLEKQFSPNKINRRKIKNDIVW